MRSACHFHSSAASKKGKKPPLQSLSSGQCPPHSFGVESPLPLSGAQHRGLAPSWCRHDAADRVAKAASGGFALVEASETVEFVAAAAACGDNHQRLFRHVSQVARRRVRPLSSLPSCTFRLLKRPPNRSLGWSEEKLCTTSNAATSLALRSGRKPGLLPCAPVPFSPGFDPLSVATPWKWR